MDIEMALAPYLRDVDVLVEQANTLVIADEDGYRLGADFIRDRKREIESIEKDAEPIREAAHKLHQMICDKIREGVWPRKHMITVIKDRMLAWKKQADLARQELQNRLVAEAMEKGDLHPVILQEVKVEGITNKKRWRARVVNKRELIHAINKDPGLMDAVTVDMKWLDDYVNDRKGNVVIGGVEPYEEEKIEVRKTEERKTA